MVRADEAIDQRRVHLRHVAETEFPVIYMSIMVISHRRVGGPSTAAVLANAVPGLAGFGVALLTLHLTAVPLGSALALIAALGVSVAWNAGLYVTRHHESFA